MIKRIGLLLFVVLVLAPFALISQNVQADRQLPANQPKKGLIYDGLEVAHDGPCKGALRLKGLKLGRELCTHGPEAAPATMNPLSPRTPMTPAPQAAAATTTITCDGDGTSGQRVQVIYAHASTAPDQFATYKTSIQQWAAEADSDFNISASQTGGNRHVRFVHDAGCAPVVLDLAVSTTGASDFGSMINDIWAQGYNRTDRKYVIFADARVYCGIGNVNVDDQPGAANVSNGGQMYARIDAGCWSGVVAAHELMHTLGGVQLSAPHSDANFHCNQNYDNMCDHSGAGITNIVCTDPAGDSWFDCNHNDYYSTNPAAGSYLATHWNTANNQFLINPNVPSPTLLPTLLVKSLATGSLSKTGSFVPTTTFSAGSTIIARAVVVSSTGSGVSGASVSLSFKRPDGSVQCTVTATTDLSGTAQASCATKRNAPKGSWSLTLVSVSMNAMTLSSSSVGTAAFTIQ